MVIAKTHVDTGGIESNILFIKKKNKVFAFIDVSALLYFLFTSTLVQLFCCARSVMLICLVSVVCFLKNMEVFVFFPPQHFLKGPE